VSVKSGGVVLLPPKRENKSGGGHGGSLAGVLSASPGDVCADDDGIRSCHDETRD